MYYPLENWSFLPFASQVDGQVVSEIGVKMCPARTLLDAWSQTAMRPICSAGKGIMVLVGIRDGDTEHAAEQL